MSFKWGVSEVLGLTYVCCWSVSMYPPLWTNWKRKSASALSVDFVMLNTTGYFYLVISLILQLYRWLPPPQGQELTQEAIALKPKITNFDLCYCLHGFLLNLVLASQLVMGQSMWGFKKERSIRMKPIYSKILFLSLLIFSGLTLHFVNYNATVGWDNLRTLAYCNRLFMLKISMSLLKYVPQVIHNHERRSMKGFAIQGTMLDITGGMASLMQLIWQIANDKSFNTSVFMANFGKIGLAIVTIVFNFIFLSQWTVYGDGSVVTIKD
ncbi:hypothetical protein ZYGR_0N03380 [Zygosaccharomyces rouxii]|uniref:ZYRO0D08074p n=2 Tax=Zygosaccharomyces rouxii TaxID=4956 RepID=C5DVN2_ZYGRC|nr:uncharacterized protein ZYRO0D08074g [Zygosaccharomyces rouxii]KAH9200763.1 cystine transporter [Zygosaccharomyces rouxii]GAV48933.1 hypothetical protein ZYGR_0N03380 [Zygosaccharomyces rouxii]CAQ43606.1 Cystine transporter [Zygosaccharomyces rouxii]CAR27851.1 ZYRO0D08074p [Zygosaccharomyces rouxii]